MYVQEETNVTTIPRMNDDFSGLSLSNLKDKEAMKISDHASLRLVRGDSAESNCKIAQLETVILGAHSNSEYYSRVQSLESDRLQFA